MTGDLQGVAGPAPLGRASIRTTVERGRPALTCCGHVHWKNPVASIGSSHVVNVDARAIIRTK